MDRVHELDDKCVTVQNALAEEKKKNSEIAIELQHLTSKQTKVQYIVNNRGPQYSLSYSNNSLES